MKANVSQLLFLFSFYNLHFRASKLRSPTTSRLRGFMGLELHSVGNLPFVGVQRQSTESILKVLIFFYSQVIDLYSNIFITSKIQCLILTFLNLLTATSSLYATTFFPAPVVVFKSERRDEHVRIAVPMTGKMQNALEMRLFMQYILKLIRGQRS